MKIIQEEMRSPIERREAGTSVAVKVLMSKLILG
jgi:hypothetical protein